MSHAPADCRHWRRETNDSWTPTQDTIIYGRLGPLPIKTGATVRPGTDLQGADVIGWLEQNCR